MAQSTAVAVKETQQQAQHKAARANRRRALAQQVKELREQLNAVGGETRKNMRERIARVTGENAELKKQLNEALGNGLNRSQRLYIDKLKAALTEKGLEIPTE